MRRPPNEHPEERARGPGRFRLFSLFGFEVRLDLSWLLLALLIAWSLGAGVFPVQYPGLPARVYAWMGMACAIGVFFSIVFHEFSHSLVARRFGMPIKGITLFIFGGVAEMASEPPSPRSEFLMAVAGPISSFVLAYAFSLAESFAIAAHWPVSAEGVFATLSYINVVVAAFNLVPAFPLDGGRMLRAVLWHWKKDMRRATYVASRIGSAFGIALMLLGVVAIIQGSLIAGMWWFLIGLFLRGAAGASYRQLLVQEVLRDQPVANVMQRDPVTVPPSMSIEEWIETCVYRHHFKAYPVVEDGRLSGFVSIDAVKTLPRERWSSVRIRDVMEPVSDGNTVSADTDTTALLAAMVRPDTPNRLMVVDGEKLVGMISVKDLMELIALKLEIGA